MKHLLLVLLPDKQATLLASVLSAIAFLLGVLDMLDRDFEAAGTHMNLSVAIMGFLFILKFLSTRATFQVAEQAQAQLQAHIKRLREAKRAPEKTEAEVIAQERAEIAELTENLKQALNNIAPDSPVRPKYEATLELMARFARRGA